ncbi:MAG: ribonucleoside triphosphate reductase, partial [Actinomycetaceae bacterium]|nr:ribonucleoside triphosphate reductase [Actinomycetaceae bacterium]
MNARLKQASPQNVPSSGNNTADQRRYDIDALSTVDEYLDRSDWRVNANANQGYSLGGMILNTAGKVVANYWLEKVYSAEA